MGSEMCIRDSLLLEHGADPLAVDAKGRSPLSLAAADARDHRLVARMLAFPKVHADFAHGDDEATVLMLASALPEASSVLRTLLGAPDLAADSGLKNMRGRRKSAATCARADLRRKDARGRTALFYAAEADRAENVELLLSLARRVPFIDVQHLVQDVASVGRRRRRAPAQRQQQFDVLSPIGFGRVEQRRPTPSVLPPQIGARARRR